MHYPRLHRLVPLTFGLLLALTSILEGCDCSSSPSNLQRRPDWICVDKGERPTPEAEACPNGGRFVMGSCMEIRCDASEEGDNCCPGMFCKRSGECIVPAGRIEPCTTDGECATEGHACLDRPQVSTTTKTCGFPPLNAAGGCDNGGSPFNSRCVKQAPCNGGCTSGSVCNIDTNACEALPTFATDPSCSQSCGDAGILAYADPDSMLFDQCCEVTCACLTLPPLAPGVFGRYSDLASTDEGVVVSSYDSTYGDLVMSTHSNQSGAFTNIDYIDGFPTSGTTVAAPNGPRHGLSDPGANLGQHTSIAVFNGEPRIAYYDVDNHDLKFARYDSGSQSWSISTVHQVPGDVGRYTSLVIDPDGIAHIAYYAHRIETVVQSAGGTEQTTGPWYARAKSATPNSTSDWETVPIEVVPSCHGACTPDQSCVKINHRPVCMALHADCANCEPYQSCVTDSVTPRCETTLPAHLEIPCGGCDEGSSCVVKQDLSHTCLPDNVECSSCPEGTRCVTQGGNATCRPSASYTPLAGIPEGVGLFTSIALYKNTPIVSYYDRLGGHLRGAAAQFDIKGDISNGFRSAPLVALGDDDVGQHARLAVHPDGTSFVITYQALDGETLWAYSATDMLDTQGTTELVDAGVRGTAINLVGGSSSPAFDDNGKLYIAYADQTNNDVIIAQKTTDTWTHTPVITEGAAGSFSRLLIADQSAYISTFVRMRDSVDRDISTLKVHVIDLNSFNFSTSDVPQND
ncbi:MAG: hypothetical protein VX699_07555 [Myxococcota bacterium]|nr:hypothetical protein [Myxococcota bacterium]